MVELEKSYKIYHRIHHARSSYIIRYALAILILIISIWIYINQKNTTYFLIGLGLFLAITVATEIIRGKSSILYVTSKGLTKERGIIGKEFVTINYEDILRTKVTQSVIERIFNYGDMEIDSAGMENAEMDYQNLPHPMKYKKIIDKLIDKANTMVKKK